MTAQPYALLNQGVFTGRLEFFDDAPPQLAPEKGLQWVRYIGEDAPAYDPMTRAAEPTPPERNASGELVRGWTVRPLTLDEIRAKRQPLIDAADLILRRHYSQEHYGLATTLTNAKATEWAAYLQALRDVTLQDPASLVWPAPPA
ncbi:MAG: hypothetical protein HQL51_10115 [Magnetococcales bacterium]|nr:hypothetical protein [Magnetococcales bacterium]